MCVLRETERAVRYCGCGEEARALGERCMVGQGKTGALGGAILIGVCGIERETECVCVR